MKPRRAAARRLNFMISEAAYEELHLLWTRHRCTAPELVHLGIKLMGIVDEAERNQHRLMIVDADGKAVKEILVGEQMK